MWIKSWRNFWKIVIRLIFILARTPRFHFPNRESGRHTFLSHRVSGHLSRHLASPFRIMPMLSPCGHFEKPLSNIWARNKRLGGRFPHSYSLLKKIPLLFQLLPSVLWTILFLLPFFLSRPSWERISIFQDHLFPSLRRPPLHGDRFVSRWETVCVRINLLNILYK